MQAYNISSRLGAPAGLKIEPMDGGYEITVQFNLELSFSGTAPIKLVSAVGKNSKGREFYEINIYNGSEEFEGLSSEKTRLLARAYVEIADLTDSIKQSLPDLPAHLKPYLQAQARGEFGSYRVNATLPGFSTPAPTLPLYRGQF